jgi:hypothetical protein
MKLTKILREKTIKELDNARNEANKRARADYEARRNNAEAEIEALIDGITPAVVAILEKYGMDSKYATHKTAKENGSYNSVISLYDREIRNNEEWNALYDAERERYNRQKQLIEEFALECELGVEKANFLEALANLCKKIAE